MKDPTTFLPSNPIHWRYIVIVLIIISVLALMRFVHLTADFPAGITTAGVLYTDEGWYANAAIRIITYGTWYLDGDFNPAINMPMGQILHSMVFSVFGMSLFSARLPEAFSFVLIICLTAFIVKSYYGVWTSLLTALLLASNFTGFAYSRLAIMEPIGTAFVVAALLVAIKAQGRRAVLWITGASLLVVVACLTKGSMIFAAPLIAYVGIKNAEHMRERVLLPSIVAFIVLGAVIGYQAVAKHLYPIDYVYFNEINIHSRLVSGVHDWYKNLLQILNYTLRFGKGLIFVSTILIVWAAMVCRDFYRKPLVDVLFVYIIAYVFLLSTITYSAPRYFIPLLVPFSALCAIAYSELMKYFSDKNTKRWLAYTPVLLVAGITLFHSVKIGWYLASPNYTFVNMAHGVSDIIRKREGNLSTTSVIGGVSDSIALETGIRSLAAANSPFPLTARLQSQQPKYAILLGTEGGWAAIIEQAGGKITKLGTWDVYGNYYNGQPVQLLGIDWN